VTAAYPLEPSPGRRLRLRGGPAGAGGAACAVCWAAPLPALPGSGVTGVAVTTPTAASTLSAPGPVEPGCRPHQPERAAP
jgi:hypothetical protein